jgi:aminocarboxymuconate-semialdehyde decarboxylase
MSRSYLKVDIFNHILPKKYKDALDKAAPGYEQKPINDALPTQWDMDHRFRIMDKYEGLVQVLTLSRPPIEEVVPDPKVAMELTRIGNDEIAELVFKYPDRFAAGVSALAMNDLDGSLKELERCITELKFKGVQLYTDFCGKPMDSPEFMPIYEMMAHYNLPIWIHPTTGITAAEYKTEKKPKYITTHLFGWPYETTMAMSRLVFSGVLDRWPNLKVITHHAGGMIPFYEYRITGFLDEGQRRKGKLPYQLTRAPIEYYKMFYTDTAIYGSTPGLMLARQFFGTDHLMFGTDFPFSGWYGERVTKQTIASIEDMEIPEEEKKKIFVDNARKLMRLPI